MFLYLIISITQIFVTGHCWHHLYHFINIEDLVHSLLTVVYIILDLVQNILNFYITGLPLFTAAVLDVKFKDFSMTFQDLSKEIQDLLYQLKPEHFTHFFSKQT